jgi:methylated-DNA-[protein]-cysteine S-methyltransferase
LIGGSEQMSAAQIFFVEHIDTPTGRMRIVSDDVQRLRAVDWEDHETRMRDLLVRYYGPNAVTLRETSRPSHAAHALAAYFDGDLDAIADLATEKRHALPARRLAALRRIPSGRTMTTARSLPQSDSRRRCARSDWRTAPIPSPSLCRAIG